MKATLVLFTKKLLKRDFSTVPLYEEPLVAHIWKLALIATFCFPLVIRSEQLVFLRGLSVITQALGAVHDLKLPQPGIFC